MTCLSRYWIFHNLSEATGSLHFLANAAIYCLRKEGSKLAVSFKLIDVHPCYVPRNSVFLFEIIQGSRYNTLVQPKLNQQGQRPKVIQVPQGHTRFI